MGRIDIVWRGPGPLADAGGPAANAFRRAEIDQAVARLDGQLKTWTATPRDELPRNSGGKRRERESLLAERARLDAPWTAPAAAAISPTSSSRCAAACRATGRSRTAMRALDARIGAANRKAAAPPAPTEAGRPYYVGDAKCVSCHKTAFAFWKKTVHAGAWKTLVQGAKQDDDRCVGCHVTGYGEVGGTSLGPHRPAAQRPVRGLPRPRIEAHVAEEGLEKPLAIRKQTPARDCTACHNERHSDTFQYEGYLRDILGRGHGAGARAKLGDGPTGHALRTAALARAKVVGKAQIKQSGGRASASTHSSTLDHSTDHPRAGLRSCVRDGTRSVV